MRVRTFFIAFILASLGSSCLAQSYYKSTARPLEEIEQVYPYNIRLTSSNGKGDTLIMSSAELLNQHKGKRPVVLMFWLTTCGPCRMEKAEIARRFSTWESKADFAFIPISIDFPKKRAEFHARAAEYPWLSYIDDNREFPLVMPGKLNGVPQIFVFDKDGEQVFHRRKWSAGDLEALEEILVQQGAR